jgi:hypothetical protein
MKNVVWKFEIKNTAMTQAGAITLPPDVKIAAFGRQTHPYTGVTGWFLWAVIDPEEPTVRRNFIVVATGKDWEAKDFDYVMTAKGEDGFVWHLLEWRRA